MIIKNLITLKESVLNLKKIIHDILRAITIPNIVVFQLLCCVWLFATAWTEALQASLSLTISRSLLKLMSIESVMTSNQRILCCLLLLLPSIFLSIRVFSNEWALCIRWPKSWSFNFSIILPMNIQGWFPLELTSLISMLSKRLSWVFSRTTIRKHQFFRAQPSLYSNSHICTWLPEKP